MKTHPLETPWKHAIIAACSYEAQRGFRDGKQHTYWSMVESVRVGRRVFQRQALYLGELNDSQGAFEGQKWGLTL